MSNSIPPVFKLMPMISHTTRTTLTLDQALKLMRSHLPHQQTALSALSKLLQTRTVRS